MVTRTTLGRRSGKQKELVVFDQRTSCAIPQLQVGLYILWPTHTTQARGTYIGEQGHNCAFPSVRKPHLGYW